MRLYKDKNIDIRYDKGGDFLSVKFLQTKVYLQQISEFITSIEIVNSHRVLLDLSKLLEIDQEAKEFFGQELNKVLRNSGIRKMAILKSSQKAINDYLLEITGSNKPKRLKLRFFDSSQEATKWLTDNYSKD